MKRRQRALCGVWAGILTFLCAAWTGCGKTEEQSTDEPIILTMFIKNPSLYTGLQEDPVADYIEEKFGIRIKLTANGLSDEDEEATDEYYRLLAMKLQSNDMDDIMDFGPALENEAYRNLLVKGAEEGWILALDELLSAYAPNICSAERITVRSDYRRENFYEDGKLYSLGSEGGVSLTALPENSVWIRWDLYAEAGYPDASADEELLEILEKMQKDYPETPKGETVYALGMAGGDTEEKGKEVISDYPESKGYAPIDELCTAYLNYGDMSVSCPVIDADSFFWEGIRFYFVANQGGLLDPESDEMELSEYVKKVNKGIYLAGFDGTLLKDKEYILAGQGIQGAGYMPISPLEDAEAVFRFEESVLGTGELAISSTCKHPEKAVEFLDWCFSEEGSRVLQQGAKGLAWDCEEEICFLTDDYKKDATLDIVDLGEKYGKEKYAALSGFSASSLDKEMQCIQIEQDSGAKDSSLLWEDAQERYDSGQLPDIVWSTCMNSIGEKPQEIAEKAAAIHEYVKEAVMECVYAKDEQEFLKKQEILIENATDMGIQEVGDWYTLRMEEICEEMMPVLEKAFSYYR